MKYSAMKSLVASLLVTAGLISVSPAIADNFDPSDTSRVSAGTYTGAAEPNAASTNARVSKNGRFVVFESTATNLVSPPTTNGWKNCFLYDRQADAIELVGLTTDGNELDQDCLTPSVSNDGRYVAFASSATVSSTVSVCLSDTCHLNKTFSGQHIWVRDRLANRTMLISQVTLPVKRQQIDEATGNPVVADAVPASAGKVPVMEKVEKRVAATIVGVGAATSSNPRISADGQFVVFDTDADNLVLSTVEKPVYQTLTAPADFNATTGILNDLTSLYIPLGPYADGNGVRDVYVRDGATYTNSLLSLACKYHEPNKCSIQGDNDSTNPVISDDGGVVVFATATKFLDLDFNNASDIFMVKRTSVNGEVSQLSRISNNTSRILAGNGASTNPGMSADGRYVAFQSDATNLVSNDTNGRTDIFVFDTKFNRMIMCSKPTTGLADQNNTTPDISGAGEYVVFQSTASTFGVSTGISNIYMGTISKGVDGDATGCTVQLVSKGSGSGSTAGVTNSTVGIVPRSSTVNGVLVRTRRPSVAYQTSATNITTDSDTNGLTDIFQSPVCSASELATDTDGDGTSDCFDQCASDPIAVEADDTDADGVADCEDGCSSDPQKVGAGVCGCGVPDTDTDADGKPDCTDLCPNDPLKTAAGDCGCGIADTDADGNGTADCNDSTNPTPSVPPTPTRTPTPVASATPSFDLTAFTPQAPSVKRASGKLKVKVTFSTVGVTDATKVANYDLTARRLAAGNGTVKRGRVKVYRKILDGVITLPSSGKYVFSAVYNGTSGEKSQASPETRALNVQ